MEVKKRETEKCGMCGAQHIGEGFEAAGDTSLALCKKCALELYKKLAVWFVPKSIPHVLLRNAERATIKPQDYTQPPSTE
jgi:ribosome-binding protein aMBF1 (putative translation factor)